MDYHLESSDAQAGKDYHWVQHESRHNVSPIGDPICATENPLTMNSTAAAGIKRMTEVEGLYTSDYLSEQNLSQTIGGKLTVLFHSQKPPFPLLCGRQQR